MKQASPPIGREGDAEPDRLRAQRAAWLLRIEERAASPVGVRWSERVLARLDTFRSAHGDTFRRRPLISLIDEIGEECDDIAGWAMLTHERLGDYDASPADLARITAALEAAATLGGQAASLVAVARRAAGFASERGSA